MSFFPRRAGKSQGGEGPEPRAPRGWEASRQRSLALPKLVEALGGSAAKAYSVLDLGPATPSNLEFFLGRGARFTVADFAPSRTDMFSELIGAEPGTHFDLVLAWDFLNYLPKEKLGLLLRSLEPYFRPGTAVHALVATGRHMPAAPRRYRIESAQSLVSEGPRGRVIPSPRYVEQDLLRCMPGLIVEHRFQLRNEMLEYLFSYRTRLRVAYSTTATAPLTPLKEAPRSRSGGGATGLRQAPSR